MENEQPNAAKTVDSATTGDASRTVEAPAAKSAEDIVRDVLKTHSTPASATEKVVTTPEAKVDKTEEQVDNDNDNKGQEQQELNEDGTVKTKEQAAPVEEADAPVELDKPEDAALPFHKHPRFLEVIKERNEAKESLAQYKPLIDQATAINNYREQHNIKPQTFEAALNIAALMENDPAKALEALRPHYEQLQRWNGELLPDDLQAQVAAGTLPIDLAKELSLARLKTQQGQQQGQTLMQQQQELQHRTILSSLQSWAEGKRTTNPDFAPKKSAKAPDGVFEIANMKYSLMVQQRPPQTPSDAIAMAETALAEAQGFFKQFRTAPTPTKSLAAKSRSSSTAQPVIKNEMDVARAILAGKRPHELKYADA